MSSSATEYTVDGQPFDSEHGGSIDFNLRAALAYTGGQVAEAYRGGHRCGYLDREAFNEHFRVREEAMVERAARPPAIPFVETDGGRGVAGYKGYTGDCVVRAIAIATEQPYATVYDALHQGALNDRAHMAKLELKYGARARAHASPRTGVAPRIYKRYLEEELGWEWVPTMQIGQGCTVHLRADELPTGRLIVRLSRHVAAVVDGVLHDNHDSSRDGTRCVYGYWKAP